MLNEAAKSRIREFSKEKMPPVAVFEHHEQFSEFHSNDSLYPQVVTQSLPRVNTLTLLSPDVVKDKTYEETMIMKEQLNVEMRLEAALHSTKENILHTEILLPDDLLSRIAHNVITMSESEPCGLNGCVLYVNLENRTSTRKLCKFRLNGNVVATFELHLTLKEDSHKWLNPLKVISVLEKYFTSKKNPVLLSSTYQIEKKKLYRSKNDS